jgi:MarR family transcriptional regulator, temperature-dependent positive regulator of motility
VVEALHADILAPLSRAERATFLALARKALGLG